MLDLAKHIVSTKKGEFDPAKFDDRYEAALEKLVRARMKARWSRRGRRSKRPSRAICSPLSGRALA